MLPSGAQHIAAVTMEGNRVTTVYRDLPNCSQADTWRQFVNRVGQENLLVNGRTRFRHCEIEPACLTLRAVWDGSEILRFRDGRHLRLDDDCFVVLNGDTPYSTHIVADEPVASFTLYFRYGIVHEVYAAFMRSLEDLLDDCDWVSEGELRFNEHLREHGGEVSRLMSALAAKVDASNPVEDELHESLIELLFAMMHSERQMQAAADNLGLTRRNTRAELFRRLHLARDFIHGNYEGHIGIADMASHASISTCHFVRFFKKCFGITPHQYLCRKRSRAAERLIKARLNMPLAEVAQAVGFENRQTLFRNLKKFTGRSPSALRNN